MKTLDDVSSEGLRLNTATVHPNGGLSGPTDMWQLVVLNEILQELRKLNALLHCSNFTGIPKTLNAINRNTRKRRRVKEADK